MQPYQKVFQRIVLFITAVVISGGCNPAQPVSQQEVAAKEEPVVVGGQESAPEAVGASDRLRIMSYNVLRYGSGCQAPNGVLHGYLSTIVRYANPDVVGLVKVNAIHQSAGDEGDAPQGFADSILVFGMNRAFSNRYAVCPFTNKAHANNVNLLFYDRKKLGYAGMETLVSQETDFNLYKLYLRSSVTGSRHDTTFLYLILNHTASGDDADDRDRQMVAVMHALQQRFRQLPNMITMGDFNLRNTSEHGYQALLNTGKAELHFVDPPFALDHAVSYPADWDEDPAPYARWLTTSTRKKDDKPNDCGTGGGAKSWYDHILLSAPMAVGKSGISYIPGSFKVLGNDGNRTGRSVNADKHPNTAVPAPIAEALFQLSNKYPVLLDLQTSR